MPEDAETKRPPHTFGWLPRSALNRTLLLALFVLVPSIVNAEAYLCVADMSTGFVFDKQNKTWKKAYFTDSTKYMVARSSADAEGKWEVKEIGQSVAAASCENGFTSLGALNCEGFLEFRMNKNSLRFLSAYLIGYWTDAIPGNSSDAFREGGNSPFVEIGKCSPL
ncbi:MAG: hypothetical protein AABZ34_14895 [Nitrospirota bacterium]